LAEGSDRNLHNEEFRNRATKNEMDREWTGVKKGELVRRLEWVCEAVDGMHLVGRIVSGGGHL
jgi:hypothetical protein